MSDQELDRDQWTPFRRLLGELTDEDLERGKRELTKERTARRECDSHALRLFFHSLTDRDLETARLDLENERMGRAEERREFRAQMQRAMSAKKRKTTVLGRDQRNQMTRLGGFPIG